MRQRYEQEGKSFLTLEEARDFAKRIKKRSWIHRLFEYSSGYTERCKAAGKKPEPSQGYTVGFHVVYEV